MPSRVTGHTARTVRLDASVVEAAEALAAGAGTGTTAERILGTACAALVARLCRTDSGAPAGGVLRAAGAPDAGPDAVLLPDGSAEFALAGVPADIADVLGPRASRFVAAALAEPERPLAHIELIDAREWRRLTAWSGGDAGTDPRPDPGSAAGEPAAEAAYRMFADRALRQPDAVAVSTDEGELTYRGLLERANGIARALADRGIGTGDAVGLLFDRGADSVAATLAVAMAGATSVPLDAAYPRARLRLMLSGPGVALTLTGADADGLLPVGEALSVAGIGPAPGPPPARPTPEVATVMYTSGSTGTPKGVRLTHRGVARLVEDERIDFGPGDRVLHLAPATFDASLLEVWCTLARGARLEIAPPGPLTLTELADLITGRGVTALWLTAGLFHQMAEHRPDAFAGVRRLFTGGDVVSPHHVATVLSHHPGLTVVNGYGPTENTTFTCCHVLREPPPPGTATVPIGTPVHRTRVHLVDRGGHPVPPGAPGELWTSGDGLAAGYLGLPEQSAERFPVPDSGRLRGIRCYRTGDLARFRPDGTLEFLGREDGQAKVNGHRIEPGEVEQAVLAQPGVRGACVLVESDPLGGKRLAAYIEGDDRRLAKAVRAGLRAVLPGYLVPARYIVIDRLPLTANGKIDRNRLRAGESESR
uniref:Non-ribosomal peptide synthetase A-domain containing protein n=1 Tax=Streptomyces cirratus TaxID=68187 RepID=A0A0A1GLP8_9ACTN|nr:non-ribosomal peptide synthetase A-domain containing protein [Streptomyces cirratus]